MEPRLTISPEGGVPRDVALADGRTRIFVAPADQFRLLIAEPGPTPSTLRVLRVDNALRVTGLPEGRELELSNFFGACRPGRDCALEIGPPAAPERIALGNESVPIAALSDGSFLLYGPTDGLATLQAIAGPAGAAGTSGSWSTALVGLLGLGVAAAGAGGGGGGGGEGSVAVLGATATAPTPPAAAVPPASSGTIDPSAPTAPTLPPAPATPEPSPPPAPPPAPAPPTDPAPAPAPVPAPPADTTRPTLAITDDVGAATTRSATTFTFSFSEAVTGFDAADVRVGGGRAGELASSGDGRTWTLAVAPNAATQDGRITVDVAAGAALDAAGNASTGASAVQAYDTAAPTQRVTGFRAVDNVSPDRGELRAGEVTNDRTPSITLTLDRVLGAGETLTLAREGTAIRTMTSGQSTLAFTEPSLSRGAYDYTATFADALGNTVAADLNGSASGTAFTIVVVY